MMAAVDAARALALICAANAAPVLLAWILGHRFAAPVDGGARAFDGRPFLGPGKTWRGLAGAVTASAALALATGLPALVGAAFGAVAMAGDLASSFVKRRLGHPPHATVHGLDEIPEALLPLALLARPLGLDVVEIAAALLGFVVLSRAVSAVRAQGRRKGL